MNMKLGLVVLSVFLLLQLVTSQNATGTNANDGTDDMTDDDFPGPPPFGDRPPGPPPGGHWGHHGSPPFGGRGPCGPPPMDGNSTSANNGASASLTRKRREVPTNDEGMIDQNQESGGQGGPPHHGDGGSRGPPKGFVEKRSIRRLREASMNVEGEMDQEYGGQGGPPRHNNGGDRGPPKGFFENRTIRRLREVSSMNADGGTDQNQENGGQGGPPRRGNGGSRGPPRGFFEKKLARERRDPPPTNGDDMNGMLGNMMDQASQNGYMSDPPNQGDENQPPRLGRMRRCGGRFRHRSTTTSTTAATTAASGRR